MNTNQIWIIILLLMFIIEVLVSLSDIVSGLVFLSFIAMLLAIYLLFLAYEHLRDLLEERLEAIK